jgi:hypothetical protein
VGLGGVDPVTGYDLVTPRVNPVMLERVVPADGPAAAVGVAGGQAHGRAGAVGQAHGRAVAGAIGVRVPA